MSAKSFQRARGAYGNVTVAKPDSYTDIVYLHGNEVFRYDSLVGLAFIKTCGWATPTTRTAINRALSLWGFPGTVYNDHGQMHYQSQRCDGAIVPEDYSLVIDKSGRDVTASTINLDAVRR